MYQSQLMSARAHNDFLVSHVSQTCRAKHFFLPPPVTEGKVNITYEIYYLHLASVLKTYEISRNIVISLYLILSLSLSSYLTPIFPVSVWRRGRGQRAWQEGSVSGWHAFIHSSFVSFLLLQHFHFFPSLALPAPVPVVFLFSALFLFPRHECVLKCGKEIKRVLMRCVCQRMSVTASPVLPL